MSGEPICIGGIKGKDQEMAEMQARIAELESALHLALAVAPDDPILTTAAEKQVVELRDRITALEEERDGYRNGQEQMQHINFGLIDSNNKWAEENKRLRNSLESIRIWCLGSTCEICGEKQMKDTDCYDYVRKALEGLLSNLYIMGTIPCFTPDGTPQVRWVNKDVEETYKNAQILLNELRYEEVRQLIYKTEKGGK